MRLCEDVTRDELKLFASQLSKDSENGHFDKFHADEAYNIKFLNTLEETRQLPTAIGIPAFTYVIRNGEAAIGFAIMCPATVSLSQCQLEMLYFTILEPHRKQGLGSASINLILNEFRGQSVLARCMPNSKAMVKILKKKGYKEVTWRDSKNTNLVFRDQ